MLLLLTEEFLITEVIEGRREKGMGHQRYRINGVNRGFEFVLDEMKLRFSGRISPVFI